MFKEEAEKVTNEMVELFGEEFVNKNTKTDCNLGYVLGKIFGSILIQLISIGVMVLVFYCFIILSQTL